MSWRGAESRFASAWANTARRNTALNKDYDVLTILQQTILADSPVSASAQRMASNNAVEHKHYWWLGKNTTTMYYNYGHGPTELVNTRHHNVALSQRNSRWNALTHWGQVMHKCVSKLTIIGSDNGLSPGRRQAIIWTNVGILLIRPLGTNFSEILIKIYTFSFKKIHLNVSSGKWRPSCLGLNVLTHCGLMMWNDIGRSCSTLIQVMACCLMAPSHYLNQWWFIVIKMLGNTF